MGITPIGPLAMLPFARSPGAEVQLAPMARVERSDRAEDETYSPAKQDGQTQSGSQGQNNQAQNYELCEDGQGLEDELKEAESSLTDSSTGAAPWSDRSGDSSSQISLFA